jgi:2-phospho-L-lactate guanylyltransferase
MTADRLAAIVPVKRLAIAKQRLAPALNPQQRRELTLAMFTDVLTAFDGSDQVAEIFVVSTDSRIATLARQYHASPLKLSCDNSLNAALDEAARQIAHDGFSTLLVLPADLPFARAGDIDRLIAKHRPAPALTLAAAGRDGGTNGLIASPPALVAFRFGRQSLRAHCRAAAELGLDFALETIEPLSWDIDVPADLERLSKLSINSHTGAWVKQNELAIQPKSPHPGRKSEIALP